MTSQHTTPDSTRRANDEVAFVVGGGPVGRAVADRLTVDGEAVTLVDRAPPTDSPPTQSVQAVNSFEAAALDDAGFGDATTALVLEPDDATNLLVAQHARTRFDVERVLVRLNDPDRASVYERPGIEIVDTTAALASAVTEQW